MREKILFDKNWLFHQGDLSIPYPTEKTPAYLSAKTERMLWGPAAVGYNDGQDYYQPRTDAWETVDLPHDYIIKQEPKAENIATIGYFVYENAWYRKRFDLPAEDEGKRLTLCFEGVASHATVYLNGCLLKHNFCGYNSFEVDITDVAQYGGENVLAVYVECSQSHEGWWYEGAGIYRHVWLVKTAPVAVDLWGVFVRPERAGEDWNVALDTTVRNDTDADAAVTVETRILDGETVVAEARASGIVPLREKATLASSTTVAAPHLWNVGAGYLYTAETIVTVDGVEVDRTRDRFGFREFTIDPERGLFVNGIHAQIKGVCGHADVGLLGKAVPDNICRYKVQMLTEMGANGFRTSHYPHSEAFMDALDEAGFIVMDETRWFESTDEGKEQLEMLVKRDRNRPSVFFWSLGNEEPIVKTLQGERIAKNLYAFVKKLDPTRLVTFGDSYPEASRLHSIVDVIGINYALYRYDEVREQQPAKAIMASECCAVSCTRGWFYPNSDIHGYMSAWDKTGPFFWKGREETWKHLNSQPWILGGYQWDGFEHRGESLWPRLCSQAGAIDLFLQKKDAFYQNLSHWSDAPMVHLLPHWNLSGREGELIDVWAYTNCDRVELFVNGKSQGIVDVEPFGHAAWRVPYAPGAIEAVGYRGGVEAARDAHTTTKAPASLKLIHDTASVEANGRDVALFTCVCLDEDGREVPDAAVTVDFITNEAGVIIGTGSDVCDHVPVPSLTRRMRAGRIAVAVKVGEQPGTLRVYAASPGLAGGAVSVELA